MTRRGLSFPTTFLQHPRSCANIYLWSINNHNLNLARLIQRANNHLPFYFTPHFHPLFPADITAWGLGIKQCVSRWSQRTTRPILSLSLTIEMYAYHQSPCAFYDRLAHFLGIPASSDIVPRLVAGAILICPRITRLGAGYPWHLDGNHQTRESSSAYELPRR